MTFPSNLNVVSPHCGQDSFFLCKECDQFPHKRSITTPEGVAKNENDQISCVVCHKTFLGKQESLRVNEDFSEGVKSSSNDICPKLIGNSRSSLDSHFESVHVGVKPFSCDFCKKSFSVRRVIYLFI